MNIEALKTFLESLPEEYCPLIGIEDCVNWCTDRNEIYWIDSDNDLYSGDLTEGIHSTKEYTIANLDTQCGYWSTNIFENSKKLSFDDFEEKYSDFM